MTKHVKFKPWSAFPLQRPRRKNIPKHPLTTRGQKRFRYSSAICRSFILFSFRFSFSIKSSPCSWTCIIWVFITRQLISVNYCICDSWCYPVSCITLFSGFKLSACVKVAPPWVWKWWILCFGLFYLGTVEPLTNDHPHQRPSLSYDHISCDGLYNLCEYESLTNDHPSYTTAPMWFWGWSYKRGSTVLCFFQHTFMMLITHAKPFPFSNQHFLHDAVLNAHGQAHYSGQLMPSRAWKIE